ncbi:MAG: hypothetical protein HWQ43_09230 [Nostoc sp. JL31]|uniref:hypothetical protein n=1 Tax=Nostoc sp. JL31 TaxID=2815395 RepID=UPI0025FAACFB|nr:hypothetical protein [Nostoc sp. JL31]MBN3889342.1 hypothetical protein [Nostoc sp. JL31]
MHTQGNVDAAPDLQFLFGPVVLAPSGYAQPGSGFTSLVCFDALSLLDKVTISR